MERTEKALQIQNEIKAELERISHQIGYDHRIDVLNGMIDKAETDMARLSAGITALKKAVNRISVMTGIGSDTDVVMASGPVELDMKNLGLLLQRSGDNCPDFYTNSLPIT